jgi:hypothetical protein
MEEKIISLGDINLFMKKHYFFLIVSGIISFSQALAQVPVTSAISGALSSCSSPSTPKTYSVTASNSPTFYTWDAYPNNGVSFSNQSGAVTMVSFPYTGFSYTLTCSATNANGTGNTSSYVVNVFETPTVTFSGASSFCQGSSTNLSASPTILSASSTLSYLWSPSTGLSSTTGYTVNASPAVNTTYNVLLTIGTCTNSQQVSVSVNPSCTYVWPGDVNNDGIADNVDILELGLHFSQTGPARINQGYYWQATYANIWSGIQSNGKNMAYVDCNGDGFINVNDTEAVFLNYGFLHAKTNQSSANAALTVVQDQPFVNQGTWGTASVFLGSSSSPVSNINGLAFTVDFDPALIDPNSFYIDYPSSFLNVSNQSLKFSKLNYGSGSLYTAITHTNNVNVSGNGKIATLHYKINSGITSTAPLTIGLSQANQSNASGSLSQLTAGSSTVEAVSTGMNELSENTNIAVYPNPASQYIQIISKVLLDKIDVVNITGKLVFTETLSGSTYQLDATNFANGVYFLSIYGDDHKVVRKKIIVQH